MLTAKRYNVVEHLQKSGGYLIEDHNGPLVKSVDHDLVVMGLRVSIKRLKKELADSKKARKARNDKAR